MNYSPVDESAVRSLCDIVGERYVIHGNPDALEAYSHDEVADRSHYHMPEVVVKPGSSEEIASIMRLANERRIPVTPRGAGSGLSGGAVPVYGGIVLSVERMNRILEIDRENLMVVVEPGVVTNEINEALKPYGLFYAGYPMSLESCFVGGNVAENAGGGKAVKYGVTARYVCGLEVVLPTGEIVMFGGKRLKDVTGYNLVQLMVGSEGTLGIFTRIILRLLPLPRYRADLLVPFRDMDTAIAAVPRMMAGGKVIPSAIEFMDALSIETSCRYLNEQLPHADAGAMLLIEVDGNRRDQVQEDYFTLGDLCVEMGALEVYVGDNATTIERFWRIRRNVAEAFKVYSPVQSLEDIVVPVAAIPEAVRRIQAISARLGCPIPCYGHAGDGNLHATPVKPPEMSGQAWDSLLPEILAEMYDAAAELGGTISGEHGIGSKRSGHLRRVVSEAEIALLRRIKLAFDPSGILNPGKILPED